MGETSCERHFVGETVGLKSSTRGFFFDIISHLFQSCRTEVNVCSRHCVSHVFGSKITCKSTSGARFLCIRCKASLPRRPQRRPRFTSSCSFGTLVLESSFFVPNNGGHVSPPRVQSLHSSFSFVTIVSEAFSWSPAGLRSDVSVYARRQSSLLILEERSSPLCRR